ncbi:hypothetical protein ACQJBY_040045 [Aegilops geniculata]
MLGQPSVIARLMGMEDHHHHTTVPATAIVQSSERTTIISLLRPSSPQAEQPKCGPLGAHHGRRIGGDYYRYCLSKMKPRRRRARRDGRRREHPQEYLLEKIKEDFRASWQLAPTATPPLGTEEDEEVVTSGRRSGGRVAGLLDGRCIQRIAQENLRREKLARYGYGGRQSSVEGEEDEGIKALVVGLQKNAEEAEQLHGGSEGSASEEFSGEHDEHDQTSTTSSEKLRGMPATRIAILRPTTSATLGAAGDHRNAVPTPSWKAVRDGGMDMEDFLREVKHRAERLKAEIKAKTDAPGDVVAKARRGWGSVGAGPERTAHDTPRQIREAVGKRLSRLESFRVFRGDRGRRDGSPSPEHRMLRSVMARTEAMSPTKTTGRGPRGSRWSPLRAGAGVNDRQSPDRDPRRSPAKLRGDDGVDFVAASPRALLRSFSAPAAGCSSEASSEGEQKMVGRSRSFSIFRGTVASLRQSLCLGGGAGKLLLMHLSRKKPSSPASPRQNFLSAGLAPPSPVSPLEVSGGRHFSGDLNCTFLPESSPRWSPRCSSEFEASVGGGESPWEWKADAAAGSDDPDTAYVREVLVAAGLFDDDDDAAVARTDSIVISEEVFEEVEDGYYYRRLRRRDDGAGEDEELGAADRRRLLFDLANEALQAVSRPSVSSSSPSCLSWWVVECNDGAPSSSRPRGRELEDEVWRHVARATADGTAEREVGRSPWAPEALCGDACAVGRKLERAIFDELVGDVVRQLFV